MTKDKTDYDKVNEAFLRLMKRYKVRMVHVPFVQDDGRLGARGVWLPQQDETPPEKTATS